MSGILDMITSQLDDNALGQLSRQLGTDRDTTSNAVGAALPVLLGALERNAQSEQGADSLLGAVERDHDGTSTLGDLGSFFGQQPTSGEARSLDHIFGARRQAAERSLGAATGLGQSGAAGLLANLAPVLLDALGRQRRSAGLDAGGLAQLLGGESRALGSQQPGAMNLVGQLLDTDGDGDTDISDLARSGASLLGGLFKR